MDYIKKEDMEEFCAYHCNARNFSIGIWHDNRMFGLRQKFGDIFIDTEHHYDDGADNYGTCKPLKRITKPIIDLNSKYNRFSVDMFDLRNWRENTVLYDILIVLEELDLE